MPKILVTGGAGFIGSHVVEALLARGSVPVVVDNFSSGRRENVPAGAVLHELDILDTSFAELVAAEAPEFIIHLAAQIDVQTSMDNPVFDAQTNILGTTAVLEAARRAGVRKIIYASSAAVFGEPCYLGIDEEHPVVPLSYYGISKHTPEHYCRVFHNLYGLDFTVLRYANVYGPRQGTTGEGGVISIFAQHFLRGTEPIIFGTGEQTRDFIFVDDIVEANLQALERGSGQICNIGTGTAASVMEIHNTMQEVSGRHIDVRLEPARPGDILHSYFQIEKAKSVLQWKPEVDLREGLKRTLQAVGVPVDCQ